MREYTNIIRDELNVKSTEITNIEITDTKYIITVRIISRYMDYIVDKASLAEEYQNPKFAAFQFDLTLPSGTELNDVKLLSESSAHRLMFAQLGGNTYRVIGFSMSNAKFLETDGKFLELRLANAASGTVSVDNVLFVTPINKKMAFAGGQLGTTAIEDIEVNYEEKEIFDLQGQKRGNSRNNLDRGVYIINHKKVIIK